MNTRELIYQLNIESHEKLLRESIQTQILKKRESSIMVLKMKKEKTITDLELRRVIKRGQDREFQQSITEIRIKNAREKLLKQAQAEFASVINELNQSQPPAKLVRTPKHRINTDTLVQIAKSDQPKQPGINNLAAYENRLQMEEKQKEIIGEGE